MIEIVCPACGTDEHLTGEPNGDTIRVHCNACDLDWDRLSIPHCRMCGGRDMVCVPEVLVERSRGTQLSITGIQPNYLCRDCDQHELAEPRDGHLPNTIGGTSLSDRR